MTNQAIPMQNPPVSTPAQSTQEIDIYIHQLNDKQKKAMAIAQQHLQTSFHLPKSNGYLEWKKKKNG